MLDRSRLAFKKQSKTEAVQSLLKTKLTDQNIHIGPSAYFCKHPPKQFFDEQARQLVEDFVTGKTL